MSKAGGGQGRIRTGCLSLCSRAHIPMCFSAHAAASSAAHPLIFQIHMTVAPPLPDHADQQQYRTRQNNKSIQIHLCTSSQSLGIMRRLLPLLLHEAQPLAPGSVPEAPDPSCTDGRKNMSFCQYSIGYARPWLRWWLHHRHPPPPLARSCRGLTAPHRSYLPLLPAPPGAVHYIVSFTTLFRQKKCPLGNPDEECQQYSEFRSV